MNMLSGRHFTRLFVPRCLLLVQEQQPVKDGENIRNKSLDKSSKAPRPISKDIFLARWHYFSAAAAALTTHQGSHTNKSNFYYKFIRGFRFYGEIVVVVIVVIIFVCSWCLEEQFYELLGNKRWKTSKLKLCCDNELIKLEENSNWPIISLKNQESFKALISFAKPQN